MLDVDGALAQGLVRFTHLVRTATAEKSTIVRVSVGDRELAAIRNILRVCSTCASLMKLLVSHVVGLPQ